MSSYVYITRVFHPDAVFYYVGSHTWKGQGLDPNYFGSCTAPAWKYWMTHYYHDTHVIRYCDTFNLKAWEGKYIFLALKKYGALYRRYHKHLEPFKQGYCLNQWWNDIKIVARHDRHHKKYGKW